LALRVDTGRSHRTGAEPLDPSSDPTAAGHLYAVLGCQSIVIHGSSPITPGVVAGRNLIELAGLDQQLRTLTHPDPCTPETRRPMWWYSHSSVRAIGLIDSLKRQPG
jgi:hypothetical protein